MGCHLFLMAERNLRWPKVALQRMQSTGKELYNNPQDKHTYKSHKQSNFIHTNQLVTGAQLPTKIKRTSLIQIIQTILCNTSKIINQSRETNEKIYKPITSQLQMRKYTSQLQLGLRPCYSLNHHSPRRRHYQLTPSTQISAPPPTLSHLPILHALELANHINSY